MSTSQLRPELPVLPPRIARLPVDARGYPVPWFVTWFDEAGEPTERGRGRPDFRIIQPEAVIDAHRFDLCWICGGRRGAFSTFVIGPMCAVNRTSAEPPSHLDCADFSARACPFLSRPHARRREVGDDTETINAPGLAIMRNPGVALAWTTRRYAVKAIERGMPLFDVGEPVQVAWYAEGRPATREEVLASMESGLPLLREVAEQEGPAAVRELLRLFERARALVPA